MSDPSPRDIRVPQFLDTPDRFATFYADHLQVIPNEAQRLGCRRILLLVSASLDARTDRVRKLERALGDRVVAKKVGIGAHTPFTDVLDLVDRLHECDADSIVCVGGSSYSDAAKIALIVHSSLKPTDLNVSAMSTLVAKTPESDADPIAIAAAVKPPSLKLLLTPTTLSAAEYNISSGATHPETHQKMMFTHPLCTAHCVVLDPELCTTTPQRLWLGTGMRAVDHCVEALCTDLSNTVVDQSAEEGLMQLVPGLLACSKDASDVGARGACQVGAWRAMEAVHCHVPLGASHAIGHHLGGVAGVPHGETSCVMLPAVMKWNKGVNSARQERVADILWSVAGGTFEGAGLNRETADAGDVLKALVRALGLPTSLEGVGVGADDEVVLDKIAGYTLTDVWGRTNPRRIEKKEQVREILRMATEI